MGELAYLILKEQNYRMQVARGDFFCAATGVCGGRLEPSTQLPEFARVTAVQNTNATAKAGVMIRETLNANATRLRKSSLSAIILLASLLLASFAHAQTPLPFLHPLFASRMVL